jgi:hypothetical protein
VILIIIALVVLVIVFCSGLLGMHCGRILPPEHLANETKNVINLATGVVGTLTALVLGLLIATAHSSFTTRNEEVLQIAADVIRLDRLLRRYGSETGEERDLLRRYVAVKTEDLFPERGHRAPNLESPQSESLMVELQNKVVALTGKEPIQMWLQSQALQILSSMASNRWLLVEQNTIGIAVPLLVVVVFWLALLFLSFGLFAPRNSTAVIALFLCAIAVAAAIEITLDLNSPFQGMIRITSEPMKHAMTEITQS